MRKRFACLLVMVAAAALAACGGGGGGVDAGPTIDAHVGLGTLTVSWTLTDDMGAPITCADVGASSVRVEEAPTSGAQPPPADVFSCSSGMGVTKLLEAGDYNIRVSLNSTSIAAGPLATDPQKPASITDGNNTTYPPVTFAVKKAGGFKFSIKALTNGPNCMPIGMGAGITGMSLELIDQGGGCVPLPMIGTQCPPATGACIENTMTLQETGILPGDYTLEIRGYQGTEDCYDATGIPVHINGGDQITDLKDVMPVINAMKVMAMTCTPP